MDFIKQTPNNTTMILAGRPTPRRWINDTTANTSTKKHIHVVEIHPFDDNKTQIYITQVADQIRQDIGNDGLEFEFLDSISMDEQAINTLDQLTGGNPIRLALALYLWQSSQDEPEVFRLIEEYERPFSDANRTLIKRRFDDAVIDLIENYYGDSLKDVLRLLLQTRLGLNPARLRAILGNSASIVECEEWIHQMKAFAFTKARYNKVFLHDELYSIYSKHIENIQEESEQYYKDTRNFIKQTYDRLINYLESQIESITKQMNEIREEHDRITDELAKIYITTVASLNDEIEQ